MLRAVPLSIIRSFHCTHSNGICHAGLLTACCQQTCMTYTIAVCTVKIKLMMDKGTVQITWSFIPKISLRN